MSLHGLRNNCLHAIKLYNDVKRQSYAIGKHLNFQYSFGDV